MATSLLLKSSPSWESIFYDELKCCWKSLGEFSPHFCFTSLAQLIVTLVKENNSDELYPIIQTIEEIYTKGDEDAHNAITLGLLENIQRISLKYDDAPELLVRMRNFLGPKARSNWDYLNDFWDGAAQP